MSSSETAEMSGMSCSMIRMLQPVSKRTRSQQRRETFGLRLGDAGRRLVEQQHLRLGGEHAGEVDDATQAGRQLTDELVAVRAELEQLDELLGPFRSRRSRDGLAVPRSR